VAILGPSDLTKFERLVGLEGTFVKDIFKDVARCLARKKFELLIIPDSGVSYEISRLYKHFNGKKVIGIVPRKDKEYGIKHLQPQLHILDEELSVSSWHDAAPKLIYNSDHVICLGLAPGVFIELGYVKYNLLWKKEKVKNLIVFRNMLVDGKLPIELEDEISPILHYVDSVDQLEEYLK